MDMDCDFTKHMSLSFVVLLFPYSVMMRGAIFMVCSS